MLDHVLAVGAVFQLQAKVADGVAFDFLPVPDVAFALQHFGQAALQLGRGNIDVRPLHHDGVADASHHIGNRIGKHAALFPYN